MQKKEPLQNKQVNEQMQTPEGKIVLALVQEFLEYCNLHFTSNVYEKEASFDAYNRDKLVSELKQSVPEVQNNINQPLLTQLIKLLINKQTTAEQEKEVSCQNDSSHNDSQSSDEIKSYTSISLDLESASSDVSRLCSNDVGKNVTDVKTKPKDNKLNVTYNLSPVLKSEQKIDDKKAAKNTLSSLADLPPIQLNKRTNEAMLLPSLYKKEKSSVDKSLDVDLDNLDSYEEDVLMSPVSNGQVLDNAKTNLLDSIKAEISGNKTKERLQEGLILDKMNQNVLFSPSDTLNKTVSKSNLFNETNSEDFDLNNVDDILNSSASN